MPIDIEEFESAASEELQAEAGSVRESILQFLAYDPGQAYTHEELQSAVNVETITLLQELSGLEQEGLVRHKGSYWAIAEGYDGDDRSIGEQL